MFGNNEQFSSSTQLEYFGFSCKLNEPFLLFSSKSLNLTHSRFSMNLPPPILLVITCICCQWLHMHAISYHIASNYIIHDSLSCADGFCKNVFEQETAFNNISKE